MPTANPALRLSLWIAVTPALLLTSADALAQANSVIRGQVVDAANGKPVADVLVTATSPALGSEAMGVTDAGGYYRISSLPAGDGYVLHADRLTYKNYQTKAFTLHSGSEAVVSFRIMPETLPEDGPIIDVIGQPVIDYSTGNKTTIGPEFARRIPTNPPGGKGSAGRSFESLATFAPGTFTDTYGVSMNGTTSPESGFIIDGLSANDAAFATLGTPLSSEFVREVNVITAGYLPEYGRAIGGVMDVVTKSGSNQFHGSFFSSLTPGALEGRREKIPREGSTITTDPSLGSIQDVGFELGGPLIKDKLWFYTGLSLAIQKTRLDRRLNKLLFVQNPDGTPVLDSEGNPIPIVDKDTGYQLTEDLPGTARTYYASSTTYQYIGKLTWNVNSNHNVTLSIFGVPTTAGGNGQYPFGIQSGAPPANLQGSYDTLGGSVDTFTNNVVLKTSSAFSDRAYLLDTTLGWVHGSVETRAADGSGVNDIDRPGTLAYMPNTTWRKSTGGRHAITEFENLPAAALDRCAPGGDASLASVYCPVVTYFTGGPGALRLSTQDRVQGRAIFTAIKKALGTHVIKAGADFEILGYTSTRAISGGNSFYESRRGDLFSDARRFGFLRDPDEPVFLDKFTATSRSFTAGGFVQDSWNILDRFTVNLGFRYDAQVVTGNDGRVGLTLPNQWSPRVGLIWDPTQNGRAKIFGNYARFYQAVTLNLVDRSFPGELNILSYRPSATCNPRDVNQGRGSCDDKSNLVTQGTASDPNQAYAVTGSDRVPVDPDIEPQSSDQLALGGEYEILPGARLGAAYTRQWLNRVVEDMSRDEAQTYFIGNPGYGIASDFPKAERTYDSLAVFFERTFSKGWLAQASYTLSWLRGNIAGLFRPETGQLDPNINSDFDLISLLPNRYGNLPGDRRHSIKLFGAKEFLLPGHISVSVGGSYTARSGTPTNYLGSHPRYLAGEVFILPRGSGENTPWVHSFDANVTAGLQLGKDKAVTFGVDVFNLFNLQSATNVDQNYTFANVRAIPGGSTEDLKTKIVYSEDGSSFDPADKNPNFGKPIGYQAPRQIRFNMRVIF